MVVYKEIMEELVAQLIAQNAESRGLDFKGPMAWQGRKAERAELIRDLMCFANTPDGGYILVGVEESPSGFVATGISDDQAESFDPSKIGDLAQSYCSVLPVFAVHRVHLDGNLYVLIAVEEFESQPIICTRDCHGPGNKLVLRAGTVYTRTVDAKCAETKTAEDMQRVLDLAVRKRGDALLAQVAGLLGSRGSAELPPSNDQAFGAQRASAEASFVEAGLVDSFWQVEIRPERFEERVVESRAELARARDDATTQLRGWDFPHTDRDGAVNLTDGLQSVTRWAVHHEAYRIYFSGLFMWRKLHQEDYEDDRLHNKLMFESTIWSFTEIWLFASRFLAALLQSGNVVIQISLDGLAGREIVPSRPSVSVWPGHVCQESQHTLRHTISLGELRANHMQYAASDAIDLFELFGVMVDRGVMRSWQEKLLNRAVY